MADPSPSAGPTPLLRRSLRLSTLSTPGVVDKSVSLSAAPNPPLPSSLSAIVITRRQQPSSSPGPTTRSQSRGSSLDHGAVKQGQDFSQDSELAMQSAPPSFMAASPGPWTRSQPCHFHFEHKHRAEAEALVPEMQATSVFEYSFSPASSRPQTRSQSRRLSLEHVGLLNHQSGAMAFGKSDISSRHSKRTRSQVDSTYHQEQVARLKEIFGNPMPQKKKMRIDLSQTDDPSRNQTLPNPSTGSTQARVPPPAPHRADSGLDESNISHVKLKPILKRTKTYPRRSQTAPSSTPAVQFPPTLVTKLAEETCEESDWALPARRPDPTTYLCRKRSAIDVVEKQKQMAQFKTHEMPVDPQSKGNVQQEWPLALPPPSVIRYGDLEEGQTRFGSRWYLDKWGPYCPAVATGVIEAGYAVHGLVHAARGLAGRLVESMRLWQAGRQE